MIVVISQLCKSGESYHVASIELVLITNCSIKYSLSVMFPSCHMRPGKGCSVSRKMYEMIVICEMLEILHLDS